MNTIGISIGLLIALFAMSLFYKICHLKPATAVCGTLRMCRPAGWSHPD